MDKARNLQKAALESDTRFSEVLLETLDTLGWTIQELSKKAGVSPSALYKITNETRSPSLEVLRKILNAIREAEGMRAGNFIALIVTRRVLDEVVERSVQIGGETVKIREYPAATVEDAIVSSIRAERDGAVAVVCAPIVSPTIEKILDIPIATIVPKDSVTEAIKVAARKSKV
ncbi:MAG: helix-turn-helix domain-containing protein [Thermoplasmata archaeon]|jgi:predicted transcriptional regulator|nr:helix-turn-helix domain-containing protein [Thermoplasmata archaeon]